MMERSLVACPVCTLYLREGMSLSRHLDTHPKDQVIDALVRFVNPDRGQIEVANPVNSHHNHSSAAIVNPYQVVSSEEHIFYGRQQVTNIIHTPMVSYPIYQQQPVISTNQTEFIHSTSSGDRHHRSSEIQINLPSQGINNGNELITALINVSPNRHEYHQQQSQSNANDCPKSPSFPSDLSKKECKEEEKCELILVREESASPEPVASPMSCHSGITVRTDLTVDRISSQDQFITGDCDYDEEEEDTIDSGEHSNLGFQDEEEDIISGTQRLREYLVEDDEERSDTELQNMQANECMPARGELSGQGSMTTTQSWTQQEEVVSPESTVWEDKKNVTLKSYACLYCELDFTCPKERRAHVASHHCPNGESKPEIENSCMCVLCGFHVSNLKDLKVHLSSEHKKITRLQCTICEEIFKNKDDYNEHLLNVHPLECRTCGKTFRSKSSLMTHTKIHLEMKPYPCTLCSKSFITNHKLKEHMNGHTGLSPIQCNLCEKKFKRYSNLKQHKDSVHFQIKKPVKEHFCECGETFPTKKKLAWHKETHADKPKQCMYCSERYIHNASLTRHIRKAHNSEYLPPSDGVKKKNVVCPICNMTFIDSSIRAHMKQHGTAKQFGCIVCGKKFYTKWNLNLHRWTHASRMSKPFKCNLCLSAFIRRADLQAHVRSHYNNKPYTCNHCGKQFNRKHNWNRHEKEHLNEKKYACDECGKRFHRHYYLVDHIRMHSGAKPYSCHICNKTSSTKSNHNKHIRTHHARVAVNTEA